MPAPGSIVAEKVLAPRVGLAGASLALGPQQTYRIIRTTEVDGYDLPITAASVAPIGAAPAVPPGDSFKGKSRKAAKLSIAVGNAEPFDDVADLVADLPADKDMAAHDPPITTAQTSGRVDEEKRNVRVRAFLYAASREDDNDFHLIIGRRPDVSKAVYMTVELSGLPPKSSKYHARLKKTRDVFKAFFSTDLPGTSYDFYDPPVPVEVQGSLFFDMSHANGSKPGPGSLRNDMPTIWEIHPISRIVFEP